MAGPAERRYGDDEDEPLLPSTERDVERKDRSDFRARVYLLMEEPSSSTAAMVITLAIGICIVLSVVAFCIETIPSMERYHTSWFVLETLLVGIFTVEFVIRFWATVPREESFYRFITDPFNVIDILAIAPYYCDLVMRFTIGTPGGVDLRVLRALRLMRLLKLGRYSSQAKIIAIALGRSGASLLMLCFLLLFALILFSTLIFLVERGQWNAKMSCYVRVEDGACSPFQSIPEASWWAITTMTTVGYGDVYPKSDMGRVVAAFCMVVGILSVALPTTVLGVQFADAYEEVSEEMHAKAIRRSLPAGRGLHDELAKTMMSLEGLEVELTKLMPELHASLLQVTESSPMKRAAVKAGWAPLAEANVRALGSAQEFLRSIHQNTRQARD